MLELLKNKPNETFTFDNDNEAKMLLLELGLAGRLNIKPPNISPEKPTRQAVLHTVHPTHFILAILYLGNSKKEDNGYLVYCLPKSKCSFAKFNTFADRILQPESGRVAGIQGFSPEPPDN